MKNNLEIINFFVEEKQKALAFYKAVFPDNEFGNGIIKAATDDLEKLQSIKADLEELEKTKQKNEKLKKVINILKDKLILKFAYKLKSDFSFYELISTNEINDEEYEVLKEFFSEKDN